MILTLDVGNSQLFGGVWEADTLKLTFRKNSKVGASSDEYGLFFRSVLREHNIDPASIQKIALCSVVPELVHSLMGACHKYFDRQPFVLQSGTKTGLNVRYRNPLEVGADRIANAIGATALFPDKNLIVVDLGTATSFEVISAEKEFLGGLIAPGPKLSMEALVGGTAKLRAVEICVPQFTVGRSTVEGIQAGIYYGHLGMIREVCARINQEHFSKRPPVVIGTGGFVRLFDRCGIFDAILPDLVLFGLQQALKMNT